MISFPQFSTALRLVDPDVRFEWGTKYLYLVPAGVTRDKWEGYAEVCRAYEVPYRDVQPPYRFFVRVKYCYNYSVKTRPPAIFSGMPWSVPTPGGGVGGEPAPDARPRLSGAFRQLQERVALLVEYHELSQLLAQGRTQRTKRLHALDSDPFVKKWR